MPRGFSGVRQASAEIEARRSSGGGSGGLWFRLAAGEETTVRFLEQDDDIFWCMMHEVPVEGRQWGRDVPCCDQERDGTPCPGCERETADYLKRRFKGYINVIWFDAPVFKRDGDGKIVKDRVGDPVVLETKPQVAKWSSGIRLFEELDEINTNFKGLMSRRFRVKRKGTGFDTKYIIVPEDIDSGPQPMTDEELKLAEEKTNFVEQIPIPSYEEFLQELGEGGPSNHGSQAQAAARRNPFIKNRS